MGEYFKNNLWYNYQENLKIRDWYLKKYQKDLKKYLDYFNPNINILEI
jgi:hypothetical protein